MRHRGTNTILNLDWITVVFYILLVLAGWLNIYSAVYDDNHQSILDFSMRYGKQLIWIGVAFVLIVIVLVLNSDFFYVLAPLGYTAMLGMLILVLIIGDQTNGAKSWIAFSETIKIQPSEFAKLTTALLLSRIMSAHDFKINNLKDFCKAAGVIAGPIALILMQPDMGSIIVFGSMIFVFYREGLNGFFLGLLGILIVLFITCLKFSAFIALIITTGFAFFLCLFWGIKLLETVICFSGIYAIYGILYTINLFWLNEKFDQDNLLTISIISVTPIIAIYAFKNKINQAYAIAGFLVGATIIIFSVDFVFHEVMTKHQQTLINVFLGNENDPKGTGYNVEQSKIAIGSGGFSGKGYLEGTQTKYNFVPEQATDFIFCTVGEEWGFVGSSLVVLVFLGLILRIINLAEKQRSAFSRIYGYCVASILFFHLMVNIGMTIGMLPVIGIPLPFFSYGGSSLWSFSMLLFIFLRMDASRDERF